MLIKWIRCQVEPENKKRFEAAQARWDGLHGLPGFLGQAGGWNTHKPTEACIVSFWETEESYRDFMQLHHDPIYEKTQQAHTYSGISVLLYDGSFRLPAGNLPVASQWLSASLQRYTAMLVSHGRPEASPGRDTALLIANGKQQRNPDETICIWLDVATASHPSHDTASILLEKSWLVV